MRRGYAARRECRQYRHAAARVQGMALLQGAPKSREHRRLSSRAVRQPDAGMEQARGVCGRCGEGTGEGRLWAQLQCGEWGDGACGAALQKEHASDHPARHRGRVQLEARACAAARCSDTRGGSCLWMMCAPQGAPCKRAGGLRGRRARGSTRPLRRSAPCACRAVLPCCPDSLAATTTEAVGKLLGFRHTARRRLRRAVCVKESGAGGRWSRVR